MMNFIKFNSNLTWITAIYDTDGEIRDEFDDTVELGYKGNVYNGIWYSNLFFDTVNSA